MARVTVEDCLEHEENRFALCILASQRTRQLMKGAPALVQSKNRAAITALREIAAKKVYYGRPCARRRGGVHRGAAPPRHAEVHLSAANPCSPCERPGYKPRPLAAILACPPRR